MTEAEARALASAAAQGETIELKWNANSRYSSGSIRYEAARGFVGNFTEQNVWSEDGLIRFLQGLPPEAAPGLAALVAAAEASDTPIPVGRPHRTLCDIEMRVYDYDELGVDTKVLPAGGIFQPWAPSAHKRGKEVPITIGDQATEFGWGKQLWKAHFIRWDDFVSRCQAIEPEGDNPGQNVAQVNFVCPACRAPKLAIVASLELPSDSRSDEISAQVIECGGCGMVGAAAYEESRRGSLDSEHWTHVGFRLQPERAVALLDLIRSCPTPASHSCTCQAHQEIGRVVDHRWIGLQPWNATDPFELQRAK